MDLLSHIEAYLQERYLPMSWKRRPVEFYAQGAAAVSESFTTARAEREADYFCDPHVRAGYLLYFLAVNMPKVAHCLGQIDAAERFADREVVRVLDVGCGPGTGALAVAEYWRHHAPGQRVEILGIDHNKDILQDAGRLFARAGFASARLRTQRIPLGERNLAAQLKRQSFDLIICANTLNELGDLEHRMRLVQSLHRHYLSNDGAMMIIEPALQEQTRALMALRDRVIASRASPIEILAPCLHCDACPMRGANERDWCHFVIPWKRPATIIEIDRLIRRKKKLLKFSYLILAKDGGRRNTNDGRRFLVVSDPLRSNGKMSVALCPSTGGDTSQLHQLERLDKDRAPTNAALDTAHRGNILTVTQIGRIGAENSVRSTSVFSKRQ